MRAIRQHAFGGPEELRFEDVADPRPEEGQVRIHVDSAGVHLLDTSIRRGEPGPFPRPDLPMTPGREVAGVVDEIGTGVDAAWLGRPVVAHLGMASGGYAELAVASEASLHAVPDTVDADAAVAMIGTGRTTIAILDLAAPSETDVVVVTAAAGGLGTLLVQAGRNAGATVVAAAGGARKVAFARELGAAIAVDYDQAEWADEVRTALGERPVTVVYDGVGGAVGQAALGLVGPHGRFVLYGWSSGASTELPDDDLAARGITVARLQRPPDLRPLEARALRSAADGRLVPVVGQRFPLEDAAAAHRAIESRATIGKTVLRPNRTEPRQPAA
jgi:NADPH:quinone reductase